MNAPGQKEEYTSQSLSGITDSGKPTPIISSIANAISKDMKYLKRIFSKPPGTSFLGSKPCIANVTIGKSETKVIIDSGSDITLISDKLYNSLVPKPSIHKGKSIGLTQVTHKTSICDYVNLDLTFKTDKGPTSLKVEAYLVKGMSSPLILGNDFAEQYEISILRG